MAQDREPISPPRTRALQHSRAGSRLECLLERRRRHLAKREQILAEGTEMLASELRAVDAAEFRHFVRTGNHPRIADLVGSAADLYFREGTLAYGWGAKAELNWNGEPVIMLDLEFGYGGITAFFELRLEARQASLHVQYIIFDEPSPDPGVNTARLRVAMREAQLPRTGTR